jgi:lipopolysaccharide/colanic/teichoic acid biosynthesis glycosyltransferase
VTVGKRLFDIVVSAAGLVVLAPVLLVIVVLVKLDSRGPVLYRGVRTGLLGREFRILKFRSMVPDAERKGGGSTARDDPRVTSIGRVLRRYKLDELPQLVNVLIGEMSLVGPRPELPQYTREYAGDDRLILTVRPGITDYASIKFNQLGAVLGNDAPDLVYETHVRPVKNALRVKYVRERSFPEDLRIIVRTLRSVIGNR